MELSRRLDRIALLVDDLANAEDDDVWAATHFLLVHEEALVTRALGRLDALDHAEAVARARQAEQSALLAGGGGDLAGARRKVRNLERAVVQIAHLRRMWGARLAQGETLWDLEERTRAGQTASDALL